MFPSPFEYSMPHIKTIQAENIVIYSPRVQQYITITLHWAISIQATSIMPAKKQARMHWILEICVGFYKMETYSPASYMSESGIYYDV